jgi:hypothetical protein
MRTENPILVEILSSVLYQTKEEFIRDDMCDVERSHLKEIQDEEKAAREAETSSPIDLSNDEEKSE